MQDTSAIHLIELEIAQEEIEYEVALKENRSGWEIRKIEDRIKQLRNSLKYVKELYKRS